MPEGRAIVWAMTKGRRVADTKEAIRPAPNSSRIEPLGDLSELPPAVVKERARAKGLSLKGGRREIEKRFRAASMNPVAGGPLLDSGDDTVGEIDDENEEDGDL